MTRALAILLADTSASDSELAELLLRRAFPTADIRVASDAVAFAEALLGDPPQLAIVAPKLTWAASDRVIQLLRRRCPTTRVLLFGHDADVLDQGLSPGLAIDGLARKSSAGFLALPGIVAEVLGERAPAPAAAAATSSGIDIRELPLGACLVGAAGTLDAVNAAFAAELALAPDGLRGVAFERLLYDTAAVVEWQAWREEHAPEPLRTRLRGGDGRALTLCVGRVAGWADCLGVLLPAADGVSPTVVVAGNAAEPANQEMRDIALVFSHDLKEPVQQIARLAQRGGEPSDANARMRALQQIADCAQRAGSMLDSMLEYLSVSARNSSPVLVDLNASLEQALDNLRGVIDDTDAQINADPLPSIVGDEYQMLHLFQNLISNAIKFRGRERPEVRIFVERQAGDWVLEFRDNGIGIAQPFLQRVFEMGQRLHTREEYPGTGVGLALCKRIVERHGGRIWVNANDGSGCTFYVRLPQAPSHVTRLA
jgi:signal transduction histidine kinase